MFPNPTESQLSLINKFTPVGVQAEEVVVITFIGTDNLINRSLGKWGIEELDKLAQLLPGLPLTLDHDWGEISKAQGLIFDARVRQTEVPEWSATNIWNAPILAKEGYQIVEFDTSIPADAQILSPLRLGSIGKISLGGFVYKDINCPLCGVPFEDKKCPHLIPDFYNSSEQNLAPYYERVGVFDLGEASIVLIPNYFGAGIKKVG